MTAEQLYAAIHKSKKKMNIPNEPVASIRPSPTPATGAPPSYISPPPPRAIGTLGAAAGTSRYDFKRLLSQHGSAGTHKISAVERLKVRSSGSPCAGGSSPPLHLKPTTPRKWRRLAAAQPRSDVVSSTIVEDAVEEEQGNDEPVVIQQWTSSPVPARNLTWTRKSSLETAL